MAYVSLPVSQTIEERVRDLETIVNSANARIEALEQQLPEMALDADYQATKADVEALKTAP